MVFEVSEQTKGEKNIRKYLNGKYKMSNNTMKYKRNEQIMIMKNIGNIFEKDANLTSGWSGFVITQTAQPSVVRGKGDTI